MNVYAASSCNALIRLKDDNVTRTMPVRNAVFDPTTSRYAQSGTASVPTPGARAGRGDCAA